MHAQAIAAYEALGVKTYAALGENALNGFLRGDLAAMEMQAVLDAAAEAGANKTFIAYLTKTVIPAHSSWMPATANSAVHDWMFSFVNETP